MDINESYLINQSDEHNKFWYVRAKQFDNKYIVTRCWGRTGQPGSEKAEMFAGQYAARQHAESLFRKKINEGYTIVSKLEFEKQSTVARIIGTANKLASAQWINIDSELNASNLREMSELATYNSQSEPNPDYVEFHEIIEERLSDPDCNPGMSITLLTKKAYFESTKHHIIIGPNGSWLMHKLYGKIRSNLPRNWQYKTMAYKVTESHPLYDITQKIEEALGHLVN